MGGLNNIQWQFRCVKYNNVHLVYGMSKIRTLGDDINSAEALDTVDLSYVNTTKLRFERQGNNVIFRTVSEFFANPAASQFPGCCKPVPSIINLSPPVAKAPFCEAYNPQHPTVILQDYFAGAVHRHLTITTADCTLDDNFLGLQPINVVCH